MESVLPSETSSTAKVLHGLYSSAGIIEKVKVKVKVKLFT
jgi:hypothetical protein